MMEQLILWDEELFVWLNSLGNSRWDGFWMFITNKKNWIPLYVAFAVFSYFKLGWRKALVFLLVAIAMIAITDQLCNLLKNTIVQRPRPCYNEDFIGIMRLVKNYCGGAYGFLSAHSANHFALATLLSLKYFKKNGVFLLLLSIWAAMIAYSRVYIGVHYPGDILAGALLGMVMGYLAIKLDNLALKKLKMD